MKAKILFLLSLILLVYSASAVEWEELNDYIPQKVSFVNFAGDTIYIVSNGIIQSINGGASFQKMNKLFENGIEKDISKEKYEISKIFKTGNNLLFTTLDNNSIIRSEDYGNTWEITDLSGISHIKKLFQFDNLVFLVTYNVEERCHLYYQSKNYGKNWEQKFLNFFNEPKDLIMFDMFLSPDREQITFHCHVRIGEYAGINLLQYNPKTEKVNVERVHISMRNIQSYQGNLLATLDGNLLESKDNGQSWDTLCCLLDKIKGTSGIADIEKYQFATPLKSNHNLVYYSLKIFTGTQDTVSAISYSTDKGKSWSFIEVSEEMCNMLSYGIHNDAIKKPIFYFSDSFSKTYIYKFNNSSQKCEVMCLPPTNIQQYSETKDSKYIVNNSDEESFWIFENDIWSHDKNNKYIWLLKDGSRYCSTWRTLSYVKDTIMTIKNSDKNIRYYGQVLKNDLFEIFTTSPVVYSLYRDGVELYSFTKSLKGRAYNTDYSCYYLKGSFSDTLELWHYDFKNEVSTDMKKMLFKNDSGKVFIDVDMNNTILLSHRAGIELSTDSGNTWDKIVAEENNLVLSPQIYKNYIYILNGKRILRSKNGQSWENILQNIDNSNVVKYSFDSEDRMLVYTENDLFRSKEPVSLEENTQYLANIDINIYPNPTSDIINIESGENISNIELYNLSGELLSKQNSLTIDAANLANGTYFIKMQIDGKSIYKQFIVER